MPDYKIAPSILSADFARLGEEGDQTDDGVATTDALGEEGDQPDDDVATTDALGEEGDQLEDVVTTQALGEEGDQTDDQLIESDWECTSMDDDPFDDDLLRLQQILISRELGLPLEQIRRALDDPGFDRRQALLAQKQQLLQRRDRAGLDLASGQGLHRALRGGRHQRGRIVEKYGQVAHRRKRPESRQRLAREHADRWVAMLEQRHERARARTSARADAATRPQRHSRARRRRRLRQALRAVAAGDREALLRSGPQPRAPEGAAGTKTD